MSEHFDIIIVGGGPAGLTAAIYARRAGKSVLLLEKENFGGQIATAPKVENCPGFSAVSGAELTERLYDQAHDLGARIELEEVLDFCIRVGLPVTLQDLGIEKIDRAQLLKAAELACAESDTAHNMPFEVTPETVLNAMLAADRVGHYYKNLFA